jgi:hypothetical protein
MVQFTNSRAAPHSALTSEQHLVAGISDSDPPLQH